MELLQLKPTEVLSLFDTNKDDRFGFVNNIIDAIEAGEIDPLRVHLRIKSIEDIVFRLTSRDEKKNANFQAAKRYNYSLLEVAEQQGKKSFQFHNGKFEIKEVGVKYDFSKCEDRNLEELYAKMEELKATVKQREDFLKTVPQSGMIVTDQETGDTYTVYPPAKSSTTSVAVSLS